MVAAIGPNAAGKSTLFRRIAGILKGPGAVRLAGSRRAAGSICYMPQDSSANAVLTVYESILLARKQGSSWSVDNHDLALIDDVMDALGITGIAFRDLGALSGGQRQLVAIAQTLAREPEVLLMDEPTSALDLHRQIEVLAFMRRIARERECVVFIALHDLNQALRFCDKALVLDKGRMIRCGASKDVITADMVRQVYRVEARVEPCSRNFGHVIVDSVAREPQFAR